MWQYKKDYAASPMLWLCAIINVLLVYGSKGLLIYKKSEALTQAVYRLNNGLINSVCLSMNVNNKQMIELCIGTAATKKEYLYCYSHHLAFIIVCLYNKQSLKSINSNIKADDTNRIQFANIAKLCYTDFIKLDFSRSYNGDIVQTLTNITHAINQLHDNFYMKRLLTKYSKDLFESNFEYNAARYLEKIGYVPLISNVDISSEDRLIKCRCIEEWKNDSEHLANELMEFAREICIGPRMAIAINIICDLGKIHDINKILEQIHAPESYVSQQNKLSEDKEQSADNMEVSEVAGDNKLSECKSIMRMHAPERPETIIITIYVPPTSYCIFLAPLKRIDGICNSFNRHSLSLCMSRLGMVHKINILHRFTYTATLIIFEIELTPACLEQYPVVMSEFGSFISALLHSIKDSPDAFKQVRKTYYTGGIAEHSLMYSLQVNPQNHCELANLYDITSFNKLQYIQYIARICDKSNWHVFLSQMHDPGQDETVKCHPIYKLRYKKEDCKRCEPGNTFECKPKNGIAYNKQATQASCGVVGNVRCGYISLPNEISTDTYLFLVFYPQFDKVLHFELLLEHVKLDVERRYLNCKISVTNDFERIVVSIAGKYNLVYEMAEAYIYTFKYVRMADMYSTALANMNQRMCTHVESYKTNKISLYWLLGKNNDIDRDYKVLKRLKLDDLYNVRWTDLSLEIFAIGDGMPVGVRKLAESMSAYVQLRPALDTNNQPTVTDIIMKEDHKATTYTLVPDANLAREFGSRAELARYLIDMLVLRVVACELKKLLKSTAEMQSLRYRICMIGRVPRLVINGKSKNEISRVLTNETWETLANTKLDNAKLQSLIANLETEPANVGKTLPEYAAQQLELFTRHVNGLLVRSVVRDILNKTTHEMISARIKAFVCSINCRQPPDSDSNK